MRRLLVVVYVTSLTLFLVAEASGWEKTAAIAGVIAAITGIVLVLGLLIKLCLWLRASFKVYIDREPESTYIHVTVETNRDDEFEISVHDVRGVVEENGITPRPPWNLPWRNQPNGGKFIPVSIDFPEAANLVRLECPDGFRAFSVTLPEEGWLLTSPNPSPPYQEDIRVEMDLRVRAKHSRKTQRFTVQIRCGPQPLSWKRNRRFSHFLWGD